MEKTENVSLFPSFPLKNICCPLKKQKSAPLIQKSAPLKKTVPQKRTLRKSPQKRINSLKYDHVLKLKITLFALLHRLISKHLAFIYFIYIFSHLYFVLLIIYNFLRILYLYCYEASYFPSDLIHSFICLLIFLVFTPKVYSIAQGDVTVEDVTALIKSKYPDTDLEEVFGEDSDYDVGRLLAQDFVEKAGITTMPQVLMWTVLLAPCSV